MGPGWGQAGDVSTDGAQTYVYVKDKTGALAGIDSLMIPDSLWRPGVARGMLQAEILAAAGQKDSARAVLTALVAKYPMSRRPKMALERLK